MDGERPKRVRELFERVAVLPPADRAEFLRRECESDSDLRLEVESLLAREPTVSAEAFMQTPRNGPTSVSDLPQPHAPGYRILQLLGEGGMGEVWLAEQTERVRRQVALKVIKRGMDSRQVVARFETERQALAIMDHPSIAKVHDAGTTTDGRSYFVMEYVKGELITAYCDRQRLTIPERLALFVQVCEGVQHAHHKAVVHRDIKPSNVLVAAVDGKPSVKIIDFGIAKAVDQRLAERTMFTELGVLLGTPAGIDVE